ncbi:MAG: glycerophosphodiester phosphodiesterase, partial [Chloroflexota bacterium]
LSADGQVMVIHDQTVDRTTASHGRVRELRLPELRRLDAGSHFDVSFRGESIPTLDEVLRAVGRLTVINIELTNYASPTDRLPEKTAELVRHYRLQQRVFFSSFNPLALLRIRRLVPEAPVGLLALPGKAGWPARGWPGRLLRCQALHVALPDASEKLARRAHARRVKLLVYTVNREEDMQRLFEWGVDGIFTDDPLLARAVLRRMRPPSNESGRKVKPS